MNHSVRALGPDSAFVKPLRRSEGSGERSGDPERMHDMLTITYVSILKDQPAMLFSARYTTYTISPMEHPRGTPTPGYHVELDLALHLEFDMSGHAGEAVLGPLIISALNNHAGGERRLNGIVLWISWTAHWSPQRAQSGRTLGVMVADDEYVTALEPADHRSMAQTHLVVGEDRTYGYVVFRNSMFRPRMSVADREARQRAVAHELGHAHGADDDRRDSSSTMFYRGLTSRERRSIHQRWSDTELNLVLNNIFSAPGRTRPPWLEPAR